MHAANGGEAEAEVPRVPVQLGRQQRGGTHQLLELQGFHALHVACRAERLTVALEQSGEPVEDVVLQYLNRLSDWFFVLARKLAHDLNAAEVIWQQRP